MRLISGRLSEATCFDFTVWNFNKWQEGPPRFTLTTKPGGIGGAWHKGTINPHGVPYSHLDRSRSCQSGSGSFWV
jgi:hypothetical protein